MLALSKSEGFRSTTTPSPSLPSDSSSRCALNVSARAPIPLHRHLEPSEGSAFLSSLAIRHSPLSTMFFRITFFADHYPLTLIESDSYEKQGVGYSPRRSSRAANSTHRSACKPVPMMDLQTVSVTLGGVPRACQSGWNKFPSRASSQV